MTLALDQARALVTPFYDLLTQPATKPVATRMRELARDDWRSWSGETTSKSRDEFVAQVEGFGKLIPDLAWNVRGVLVSGDHVIVRSEASGTPVGPLFGVSGEGRSFRIMTIDIHEVRDGRLAAAHHVEDWAGALRQLAGK